MDQLKKVTIIGGSGFIGTKLTEELLAKGYAVSIVDIKSPHLIHANLSFTQTYTSETVKPSVLDESFAIINLAGAPLSKKWTPKYKELLYNSRVITTKNIVAAISHMKKLPDVFICASGCNIYGDHDKEKITEITNPGNDFLAQLCVDWEFEAMKAQNDLHIRTVIVRTANVLGPGGLLQVLRPFFKAGLGGYLGLGKQYMPWVHWKDIVGIYIWAIEQPLQGPYNTAAPQVVTQRHFFKAFAQSIKAPVVWPIPYVLARIIHGEFAKSLKVSQNIDSSKIQATGYQFKVPVLDQAFTD